MLGSLRGGQLRSLARVCELGIEEGWDCRFSDIGRVETLWELIDDEATAHGFVVMLHDGRRVYLEYSSYYRMAS